MSANNKIHSSVRLLDMIGWMICLSSANKTQNQSTFLLNRAWDELIEWAKDGLAVFPLNSPEVLIAHSSRGHFFEHIWLYLYSPDILCSKPVLSCAIKSVCPPVKNFSTPVPLSPFYFHQYPIKSVERHVHCTIQRASLGSSCAMAGFRHAWSSSERTTSQAPIHAPSLIFPAKDEMMTHREAGDENIEDSIQQKQRSLHDGDSVHLGGGTFPSLLV